MKKFKTIKTIKGFENEKLTKEEMYKLNGGQKSAATGSTKSVCHVDGVDDGDGGGTITITITKITIKY